MQSMATFSVKYINIKSLHASDHAKIQLASNRQKVAGAADVMANTLALC